MNLQTSFSFADKAPAFIPALNLKLLYYYFVLTCTCTCTLMYTHVYTCIYSCILMYTHVHVYTCTCILMYTHVYSCILMYTHVLYTQRFSRNCCKEVQKRMVYFVYQQKQYDSYDGCDDKHVGYTVFCPGYLEWWLDYTLLFIQYILNTVSVAYMYMYIRIT